MGIACGLWLTSRSASPRPLTPPQAVSAAEAAGQREVAAAAGQSEAAVAETSSTVKSGEPPVGDTDSPPAGAENQSPEVASDVIDERAAAGHEAPGPKGPGAKPTPSAEPPAAAEPRRVEAIAGTVVAAGREPERRAEGDRCVLSVSESSLSIPASGGSGTITVSVNGPARVTATTNNWPDIAVFAGSRGVEGGPVRYTVVSVSKRAGTFAVNFKSPCGMKTVPVTVKQP